MMGRKSLNLQALLPQVKNYLTNTEITTLLGWQHGEPFTVDPLAQGEYNLN